LTLKKSFDSNPPYIFLVKFLLCFLILYLFFPFYRGITGVGGKIYFPFLDHHFNLIKGLSSFLTGCAKLILQLMHYEVNQQSYNTLRIAYSGGIRVNPSCLGWGVMSFWIAFVYPNSGNWRLKLKWMIIGVTSICILNIIRITLIAAAIHHHWQTITSLDYHQTFNVGSYGCVFILVYLYIQVQKKYQSIDFKRKQQKDKFSAV